MRVPWANLNGRWEFRFDAKDQGLHEGWEKPGAAGFDRTIVVPFPWESELSGVHETKGTSKIGWYRRRFTVPKEFPADHRVWLRFGAVDWRADVWVNGRKVAEHEGGYTPFEADISDALKRDGENVVVVRAFDPTDPGLPTGKQVGWYTPSSGIWQTVWLEARPKTYIADFRIVTAIQPARGQDDGGPGRLRPGKVSTHPEVDAIRPSSRSPRSLRRRKPRPARRAARNRSTPSGSIPRWRTRYSGPPRPRTSTT